MDYKVQVFVAHGYYQYEVATAEKAIAHAQAITNSQVYRRVTEEGSVEFYKPYKVKVKGPDLGTAYPDTFHRT